MRMQLLATGTIMLENNGQVYEYDYGVPSEHKVTPSKLWNAEGALASQENENIVNIFPTEGFALSVDNFAIPKGAKHQEELYQFIDYILRPDVMKRIIESYPYKNVNKSTDLILNDSYKGIGASNIPDETMQNGYFVKKSCKIFNIVVK